MIGFQARIAGISRIAIVTTLTLPAAVMAQSEPSASASPSPASAQAQVGRADMQDIIVTAQRRSEALSRTPVAVSALTPEILKQRAITSEADLQSAVPGLLVRSTQNSNQLNFSIRGQSVDAFTGSQPAVQPYFDEIPATTANASTFYDLESVQVLKGPQGTLFGRNVTGGAVLYTSAKPKEDFDGYLQGKLGNYNLRSLQGAINVPFGDVAALRVAGSTERRDGFVKDVDSDQRYGDVKRDGGRVTFLLRPASSLTNTTVVDYSRTGGGSTPLEIYSVPFPSVIPGSAAAFAEQQGRSIYRVRLDGPDIFRAKNILLSNITTFDLSDNLQFKNIFGYVKTNQKIQSDIDGTALPIEAVNDHWINSQYSDEAQLLGKALNGDLSFVMGGFYYKNKFANDTFVNFFGGAATENNLSDVGTKALAGYVQGTYELERITGIQGLGVTAGIRYTHEKDDLTELAGSSFYTPGGQNYTSTTANKISYQFGVQEQLTHEILLYGVTRRSFRSGGFNYFAPLLPGTADQGGNQFKPEIARDVELGAKFAGRLGNVPVHANLALYEQWIDNIQRAVNTALSGTIVALTINVPKTRVRGIEFDGQIDPASWLQIGVTGTYTDADFTQNQAVIAKAVPTNFEFGPYADTPRLSGSTFVQLSQDLPNDLAKLALRGDLYAQSHFYFGSQNASMVPGTKIRGYSLVNFRLSADEIGGSKFGLAFNVKNAFGKHYFAGGLPAANASAFGFNMAIPGEPRTIFVEASYKF